jgi:ABC-type amino acid transport substrate-binding protein
MMCFRLACFFLYLLLQSLPSAALAQTESARIWQVIYPADEDENDPRFVDIKEILRTALEKTVSEFGPFELRASRQQMNGPRLRQTLANGELSIIWTSTTIEKEKLFLPIRIPLRKGLLGYRVALITKDKQARIDQVKTLEDLRKLSVGQGVGWDDSTLFKENGIPVVEAKYSSLFRMLGYQRFDLFPRGIGEVFLEFQKHKQEVPGLAIEKNLMIYYPWPYYFFVARNNPELQRRIEMGLRKMLKDGSFDAIFWKYNAKAIEQADFKHRRIIRIKNNLLPKETPLEDASLWFVPKKN